MAGGLFGSNILEVAIGLFLVYLLLSTACGVVNETISAVLAKRAKTLEEGLRQLLQSPDSARKLLDHPLIGSLGKQARGPSYIPSHLFAVALLDLLAPSGDRPKTVDELRALLANSGGETSFINKDLRRALLALIDQSEGTLRSLREGIEKWFDSGMDRVSGWYRRRQQRNILIIAVAVVVLINADTLAIGNALLRDPALRAAAVEAGRQQVAQGAPVQAGAGQPGQSATAAVGQVNADLAGLQLPIGWTRLPFFGPPGAPGAPARPSLPTDFPSDAEGWLLKVIGLLLTACAVSLGSPFWFGLLNKAIELRSGGPPPKRTEQTPGPETPAPEPR